MSAPFVGSVRSRRDTVHVGSADGRSLTLRVEVPELWDVVRISAAPDATVDAVKAASLRALNPRANPDAYVTKLRGFEVLDERASVSDAGAVDGSIFLVTHRRRRPVR
ncbi:MAG TPA: hypothetical protein VFB46_07415 [Gemmatimonadaceae bacterium]|nr:hypothetical protein [Gemmatimonadaceae bacterium]